jgi:hypothetical protein
VHLPGEAPRRQEASAAARSCRRQLSYPQLAIKNDVHYNTIHGWAERYGEEIAVIRDDMDARATVGWAAEKANALRSISTISM